MDGIENDYSEFPIKILIIDDNPIPAIKMIETLLLRFSDKNSWGNFSKGKSQFVQWEDLKKNGEERKCFDNFYGKHFTFFQDDKLITLYIYDPKIGRDKKDNIKENNERIAKILSSTFYSYIWMDYGHSAIEIIPDHEINFGDSLRTKSIKCGAYNAIIESGFKSNSIDQINSYELKPYLAKAKQILIYTYDPSKSAFEIKELKEKILHSLNGVNQASSIKNENIIVFETSETVKFDSHKNQINGYEMELKEGNSRGALFLGTKSAYELYGQFLGNVLFDAFKYHLKDYKSNEEKRYNFFNKKNITFLEKIKLLNNRLNFSQGHKLALVSFQYKEVDGLLQFLLDTPYKNYFTSLNKIINSNTKLNPIYNYENVIRRSDDMFWIKYIYRYDNFNLYYEVETSSNLSIDFKEHLKIIHPSLFYSPQLFQFDRFHANFVSIEGLNSNYKNCNEVLYFVAKNEIVKDKGILHYALYKSVNSIDNITTRDNIRKIHENEGKFILTPMVQPTVYPILQKQIERQSNLNAISSIVIYNMTHTDGSHTIIDTENFFLSIHKEIERLNKKLENLNEDTRKSWYEFAEEQRENCEEQTNSIKEVKKELFKLLDKQTTTYNEYLRLVMEVSDALSKGFTENTYYAYNFYDTLDYWKKNYFSNKDGGEIKENFLGRGLNDGTANSIIKIRKSETNNNILFPLGELGATAFLIVLKNIFRNLKKHSRTKEKRSLKDLYQRINQNNNSKPVYEVEIKIVDNKNEKNLAEDYYKIECIEKSNSFEKEKIDEKIDELNEEFQETFNSEKMDKNWGLKEMKIFASFLTGFPIYDPQLNRDTEKEYIVHNGICFPKYPIIVDKEKVGDVYQLKHIIYLKKPKFASVILDNFSELKNQKRELNYDEIKFILKEDKNLQSSSHFVIENNCENESPPRRSHNFRYFSHYEINFDDQVNRFKESIEKKWIEGMKKNKKMNWRELDLYYMPKEGERLNNLQTNDLVGYNTIEKAKSGIIDDHFRLIRKLYKENGNSTEKTLKELKKFAYYEEQSNSCRAERFFTNGSTPYYLKVESYNIKIAILDERIQQYLRDKYHNILSYFTLKQLYELKQIYIPEFDLDSCFYPQDKEPKDEEYSEVDLMQFIKRLKRRPFSDCEYLIIHYSGFEKIVDRTDSFKNISDKNKKMKKAYSFLIGDNGLEIKNSNRFLVFTSGKSPATLPKRSLFLNFSTLHKYIRSKSKLELINLLTSIRVNRT